MVVSVIARENPASFMPDFRQAVTLGVQFVDGMGDVGTGEHDLVEVDFPVGCLVEFKPARMRTHFQCGVGGTARSDERDSRCEGLALLPDSPVDEAADSHLRRFPGDSVPAVMFVIDMRDVIPQHQFMAARAQETPHQS